MSPVDNRCTAVHAAGWLVLTETHLLPLLLLSRVKHKQELAGMKQELQKLQQESKMGQKGKDLTAKDLEAAKKKLQDVEAKLKLAVSDKQAALQVGCDAWRLTQTCC
jgi:hypothetical protein